MIPRDRRNAGLLVVAAIGAFAMLASTEHHAMSAATAADEGRAATEEMKGTTEELSQKVDDLSQKVEELGDKVDNAAPS